MLGQQLVRAFSDDDVFAWGRAACDVTDAVAVREMICAAAPAIVINATAYNAVDRAEEEPESANAVNGYAVGFLAEAAAACGASFVHYSSDYVFGGGAAALGAYPEDAEPCPISAYGRSKLLGEQELRRVATAHPRLRWYCIRLSRLFGTAARSAGAKRSFVELILERAATTDRLEVVDGECASPTYAPDLAVATRALISGTYANGIYHRTNDGACTWYAFAEAILARIGWQGELVAVPPSRFPRPAARPASSVLVTTKLPPLQRWEDALALFLAELARDTR